jgi:proteasome lid subunit RPN8/RPN11
MRFWLLRATSRHGSRGVLRFAPEQYLASRGTPVALCSAARQRTRVRMRFVRSTLALSALVKRAMPLLQTRNAKNMNTTKNYIQTELNPALAQPVNQIVKPIKYSNEPQEWKIISLRECPTPQELQICDTPEQAAAYWRLHVKQHPYFNPECECFVVVILNTRRRIKGHYLVSIGTMDTILVHPREVFRLAVMASASALVLVHNHPSGDPTPSEADIKVTRDLIRAGQLLRIEVLDHIVIGEPNHTSLRSLGYFYN